MIAADMRAAATALLDLLDDEQRSAATWPFPSDERRRWFYTPTDHGGLPLLHMSPPQHRATHRLLATGLSTPGYVTAAAIMGLENVLDHTEGWTAGFERARGRDPLLYYVSIFGDPADDLWGWRFGGHHISLHYTVRADAVVAVTPCFFGADPATSPLLGPHLHRPLAGVEDLGLELARSFDAEQRPLAHLSAVPPTDLVTANRSDLHDGDRALPLSDVWRRRFDGALGLAIDAMQTRADDELGLTDRHHEQLSFTRRPKGIRVGDLRPDQHDIVRALISCYVDRLPESLADEQSDRVRSDFDRLHVAWSGGTERGLPHYYRIQGPRLLIEYDNTQRGANHIHSVWRDLTNDFGGDALADHYVSDHHR